MKLKHFLTIDNVEIFTNEDGTYMQFISDLDVCTDGTGPSHGDKSHLSQTAYMPSLNADKDAYIVIPPQIRTGVPPVVLGCQGRATNLHLPTSRTFWGVIAEIGPQNKTGEVAICLAQKLNPKTSANVGDSNRIYLYELWPGKPAVVGEKTYKLLPAGG